MTRDVGGRDEGEWKCSGCGILSPGRVRSCDCPTECLFHWDDDEKKIRRSTKLTSLKTAQQVVADYMCWGWAPSFELFEGLEAALAAAGFKIISVDIGAP